MMRGAMWLRHRVRAWHVLLGLTAFLIFAVTVLPAQARSASAVSAGAGSPDLSLFYRADDLLQMAEAYGEAGRAAFVRARWGFDLAFPAVYGFALTTAVAWLMGRASPEGSGWSLACLAPPAAVLFDLLENTATTLVMVRYPQAAGPAAALAGWFTLVKWGWVAVSLGLLGVGLVRWAVGGRVPPR